MSTTDRNPDLVAAFERRAARGARTGAAGAVAAASAAASAAPTSTGDDVDRIIDRHPAPQSAPHHRRAVLVAAAALVAVLLGAGLVAVRREHPVDTVTTPSPGPNPDLAPGWQQLGRLPAPVDASGFVLSPQVVGDQLVLPGILAAGGHPGEVGSTPAVDLADRTWRTFAPPASPVGTSVYNGKTVRTGNDVLVFGVGPRPAGAADGSEGPPVAAALDVGTGQWRSAGSPPGPVADAVWTGSEVLAWSAGVGLVSWDPATGTWPVRHEGSGSRQLAWTGTEVVAIGTTGAQVEVGGYDPATRAWRTFPAPAHPASLVTSMGSLVAIVDSTSGALSTLDATSGTWTGRQFGPFQNRAIEDVGVGVGGRLVVAGGVQFDTSPGSSPPAWSPDALVFDPSSNLWSLLPALPAGISQIAAVAADGDRLIAIAAADDDALVVLALDVGSLPITSTAVVAPTVTGADIQIPTAAAAPDARVVVGHVPDGLRPSGGVVVAGTQQFDDPSTGVHTVPASGPRWLTVSLGRVAIDPGLSSSWAARDRVGIAAGAKRQWPSYGKTEPTVVEIGGRPVILLSSTVLASPSPGVADRQDRLIALVTGPDSTVQISTTNLSLDELDAVVRGLRVERG